MNDQEVKESVKSSEKQLKAEYEKLPVCTKCKNKCQSLAETFRETFTGNLEAYKRDKEAMTRAKLLKDIQEDEKPNDQEQVEQYEGGQAVNFNKRAFSNKYNLSQLTNYDGIRWSYMHYDKLMITSFE